MHPLLFQNATLLTFNPTTNSLITLHNHSLLTQNSLITAIFPSAHPPSSLPQDTEIIDATNKLLTPGFINTHIHPWQTALRSLGPDTTLTEYFARFSPYSPNVRVWGAEDVYVSALAGYLEAVNAGTTGFVEHAHANWRPDVLRRSYDAAADAGARVWWCCAAEERPGCSKEEARGVMGEVGARDEELVRLGYAWDGFERVADDEGVVAEEVAVMSDLGVEALTFHYTGGPWAVGNNTPHLASTTPLLRDLSIPLLFSHGGFATAADISALRTHNWTLSLTPESEMHYGHGQKTSQSVLDHASLGIDTAWTFSGDMLTQARMFLQHTRAKEYQRVLDEGLAPRRTPMSVDDAFLLLTRQGGKALHRDDLGVLAVGAKADLVLWDATGPNMAGWTNAAAAVVLHANVGDVEAVVVDGEWRKKDKKLVLPEGMEWEAFRGRFEEVARRVQRGYAGEVDLGEHPFGGAMQWGEPKVFGTKEGDAE